MASAVKKIAFFGVGADELTTVSFAIGVLNLHTKIAQQPNNNVHMDFGYATSFNEALTKFLANRSADVFVAIDKACVFPPPFVLDNILGGAGGGGGGGADDHGDVETTAVLGICPKPAYDWERFLRVAGIDSPEPDTERGLTYNVDLSKAKLGLATRSVEVDPSRVLFVKAIVLRRAGLERVLEKFPWNKSETAPHKLAVFCETVRNGKYFEPHENFLDLWKQAGCKIKVDTQHPIGIMGTIPFEGACAAQKTMLDRD